MLELFPPGIPGKSGNVNSREQALDRGSGPRDIREKIPFRLPFPHHVVSIRYYRPWMTVDLYLFNNGIMRKKVKLNWSILELHPGKISAIPWSIGGGEIDLKSVRHRAVFRGELAIRANRSRRRFRFTLKMTRLQYRREIPESYTTPFFEGICPFPPSIAGRIGIEGIDWHDN